MNLVKPFKQRDLVFIQIARRKSVLNTYVCTYIYVFNAKFVLITVVHHDIYISVF